ncbi:MAG TPA: dienelactone hydrolase family protein [Stellaceae bacterium]|jgi:dienelactone hydrolase
MRITIAFSVCAAALVSAMLGMAPARAQGLAWLGGDTVQVAARRTGLSGSPSGEPLLGYLARPDMPGRHPAVVVLHDCSGFGIYYPVIADVLKSYGYVALAIDSLGRFNACLRVGQGAAAEALDGYRALGWLSRQNYVDPGRIAVLGFSMGGIATLDSVEAGPIEKSHSPHFRSAVAYYPCTPHRGGVMSVPTLILVGDKDDWTLASWCREMIARRNGEGAPVTLIVYSGATHVFNFAYPTREYLGHHLAYNPQATADAWRQVRNFLQTTLGGSRPTLDKRPSRSTAETP